MVDPDIEALILAESSYLKLSEDKSKVICVLNNHELPLKKEPIEAFVKYVFFVYMHE